MGANHLSVHSPYLFLCALMESGKRMQMRELSGVSSYKDTNPTNQYLMLMSSFNFNYFLRDPISQHSYTRARDSHMDFGGTQILSV